MLRTDFGQGVGTVGLPVSYHNGIRPTQVDKPFTAEEVLRQYYDQDFRQILENFLKTETEYLHQNGILCKAQDIKLLSYYLRMTRSRLEQDPRHTVVDFIVRGNLKGVIEEEHRPLWESTDFRLRYILCMTPCSPACIGPIINLYQGDDAYLSQFPITTNEYLLPVLYAHDYENVAHRIIRYYFPEIESNADGINGAALSADELAARMGLEVEAVCFKDPSIMGQLYYDFASVQLIDDQGKEYVKKVKPCTILVSEDNCNTVAIRNSTIAHECCHIYLDRWFFLLQMMSGYGIFAYTNRRQPQKKHYQKKTAVDWMEYQCEKMPAYLLMESQSVKSFVNGLLHETADKCSPQNMRAIIQKVASQYHVSFSMAKYRLVELGYYEAGGIGCYLDEMLIPDHGCSGAWPEGLSYTISAEDVLKKISNDIEFKRVFSSGRYRYLEGHLCLNDRRYIEFDRRGNAHLTAYARNHVDECCMAFQAHGPHKNASYQPGVAARNKTKPVTDKYRSSYELVAEPGTDLYVRENSAFADDGWLWGEFFYHMDSDYSHAIVEIMKKKGITQEVLAGELDVDRKMIYNCLNAGNPSKPHLVAICVALKLPYFVSEKILAQAGITFRDTELDHLYGQSNFQYYDRPSERLCVSVFLS